VPYNRPASCSIQIPHNRYQEDTPNKKKAGHIVRWAGLKRFLGVGMVGVRRQSCRLDEIRAGKEVRQLVAWLKPRATGVTLPAMRKVRLRTSLRQLKYSFALEYRTGTPRGLEMAMPGTLAWHCGRIGADV
jgi:hypothetical protein